MTTELDELAARAMNDTSISSAGLGEVIKSVIDRTRRHWATMSDEHLALDAVIGVGLGYAALTRDGQAVYEENGKRHCDLMTVDPGGRTRATRAQSGLAHSPRGAARKPALLPGGRGPLGAVRARVRPVLNRVGP